MQAPSRNWPAHLHPAFVALGAGLLCIAFTFFPPGLYSNLIEEPDYMFGDAATILYIALCTAFFVLGCNFTAGKADSNRRRALISRSIDGGVHSLRVPCAMAAAAAIIGIGTAVEFIGNPALFVAALATGSAESLRSDAVSSGVDSGFSVLALLPLGFPMLLWAVYAALRDVGKNRAARRLIGLCAVVYGLCLVITLQRNLLLPYLISLFGLASAVRLHPNGVSTRRLVKGLLMAGGAVIGLFVLIAYFRGGDSQSPLTMLTGYLPASVNRLAALVHGTLRPAISGEPYYSFRFLWHPPVIRRFVPIDVWGRAMGLQIPETVLDGWVDEFQAMTASGLNPTFIWSTALGYAYYDFGWLSPLYFAALGALTGRCWNLFLERHPAGIILYPYLATCILLWPTDNLAALPQIWLFFVVAAALSIARGGRRRRSGRPPISRAIPGPSTPGSPRSTHRSNVRP